MLNLRQLNKADNTGANSDAQHFSRFSMDFRVPSDLLGNIGEPLDYSQSERIHDDEPGEREVVVEESKANASTNLESPGPTAGPSGARWEDEDRAPVGIQATDTVDGLSVTQWDNNGRASPESAMRGTGTPGTRGDEIGNALHTSSYMDGADTRVNGLIEEVHFSPYWYCCGPRLRAIFLAGAGD